MFGHDKCHVLVADRRQLSHGMIELRHQATIAWNVFGVQQLAGRRILQNVQRKKSVKNDQQYQKNNEFRLYKACRISATTETATETQIGRDE